MFRKPNALKAVALCAILASQALGNNLFVLPTFSGNSTATATVYSGNPLVSAGTFQSPSDAFLVLAKPSLDPTATKYYVISRSGSNSLITLNSAFAPIGSPQSFGQNVTAAAITPDGQRLLIVAGNLRIFNTSDDTEVRTSFLDVGLNPNDIAISPDSTRAFVMSAQGQRLTAIDLTKNEVLGNIPLPGITDGAVSMGPNGFIYVSAETRIFEIDPRSTPFDTSAIRTQFTFPGAKLTKLQFTPDGTRAIAGNKLPQSGHLMVFLNLDFLNRQTTFIAPTDAFSGFRIEDIFIAGNDRAYVITPATSVQPRKIYQLQIPAVPLAGQPIQAPLLTEAFFGSLGNIPIAESVAFTSEYPQAARMFVNAPLNLLQSAAQNTIYDISLQNNPPNVTGLVGLNFLPGKVNYAGPALTVAQEAPSGFSPINQTQPSVGVSARTLPFGVRVAGTGGRPLFGVPVTFSPTTIGVTLVGNATQLTNKDGIAMLSAVAPPSAGPFSVSVAIGSSGLSTGFNFLAGGSSGGGGGDGGGGSGGSQLTVIAGNGQARLDANPSTDPIVVRLVDSAGKPVAGAPVQWSVSQGFGSFIEGSQVGNSDGTATLWVTTTNDAGESQNKFITGAITDQSKSFVQHVLNISAGGQNATAFATALRSTFEGNPTPPPIPRFEPEIGPIRGKVGEIKTGLIKAFIRSQTQPDLSPIPNIGLWVEVEPIPGFPAPGAECSPSPTVLSDADGVATCDLKFTGRAGQARLKINVGSYFTLTPPVTLVVDPGEPGQLKKINGDNQTARINESLPASLTVQLGDGGGNNLPSTTVRWEVISEPVPGQTRLSNTNTITDANGLTSITVQLGNSPGAVQIRATAFGGTQPSVTFDARAAVTVGGLVKVSGDDQRAFTNSAFTAPLVVQVNDTRQLPVPGASVTFAVTSGSATLGTTTVTADTAGRASVTVRAGAAAGPIVITASVTGAAPVTFNLTGQLPGPVPGTFVNAASGERGAVVPGGIFTLQGQGFAPDLRGCIEGAPIVGQLPTRLNQVELQFGSTLAPIFSICNLNGQESVTFQAPFDLTAGFPVTVIARVGAGSTTINNVQVKDYQPGTFETADAQGRRYAIAIRPDGTFVTPENPARYGEIIRVFITGAGQVTPAAITGATGVTGQRLAIDVVVGINDQGVRVVSAEYARGLIGVYEIQFEVPQGTQTGASRPLGILLVRPNGQFIFPENSPSIAISQ